MRQHILISRGADEGPDAYPVDTLEEIAAAQAAMRRARVTVSRVWTGEPDDPDAYAGGSVLRATARWSMLWHGGSNYARPDPEKDAEWFDTLADARRAFQARIDNRDGRTPCVDAEPSDQGGPSAWLFRGPPAEYPDRIMECGPRGGVRITTA